MMKPDRVFADGRGVCDSCACRSGSRVFRFQADTTNYLCSGCDDATRIHSPASAAPLHEPVRSFERATPAAFQQCRADAASTICTPCDADFCSLNALARRHHSNASANVDSRNDLGFLGVDVDDEADEEEAATWMLLDPAISNTRQCADGLLYSAEVDDYLNLGGYAASYSENHFNLNDHYEPKQQTNGLVSQQTSRCCGDSVIPVQTQPRQRFESPITHTNVSLSSVDAGVVTESEGSDGGAVAGQWTPAKGTMDLLSPGAQNPAEAAAAVILSGVEREARVLRYREKKKARRFEKTIRYASRKAYAESRPRIKGRFAKRASHADQIEQTFSPPAMADHSGYDWFISPGRD